MANAAGNLPLVGFELRFTGAAGADAAAELGHFNSPPRQARQHVIELGEFDLELAFLGAGVAGEDVENELGAVDDAGVDGFLDVALL